MASATREKLLAALAAALGVGAVMCNRDQEPTAFPVQATEVPSSAPPPSASAAIDAGIAATDVPDAAPVASAAPSAAPPPSAQPRPPPLPTPLAAFDRFTPPASHPPGPPPVQPPQRCCSTSPLCGARVCDDMRVGTSPPHLSIAAIVGLKPKPKLDPEVAARATHWIRMVSGMTSGCLSLESKDMNGGTFSVEVRAGTGDAKIEYVVTSPTLSAKARECVTHRFLSVPGGLVIDGAPAKLVFPIVVQTQWVGGDVGVGQPVQP